MSKYEEVLVTLANGQQVPMRMSTTGVMISSDKDVEPIVPLGYLGGALGYSIKWSGGSMTLNHPEKGEAIVKIINGCPQVEKKVALDMIKEIEKGRSQVGRLLQGEGVASGSGGGAPDPKRTSKLVEVSTT